MSGGTGTRASGAGAPFPRAPADLQVQRVRHRVVEGGGRARDRLSGRLPDQPRGPQFLGPLAEGGPEATLETTVPDSFKRYFFRLVKCVHDAKRGKKLSTKEVTDFLRLATDGEATLVDLTTEVFQWLKSNNALDSFDVKLSN